MHKMASEGAINETFLTTLIIITVAIWFSACSDSSSNGMTPSSPLATSTESVTLSTDQQFEELLNEHWNWSTSQYPSYATRLGIRD
jgi:hypothetical protein